MYKEYDFTTQLVESFSPTTARATHARWAWAMCSIGATQTVAEYNGAEKASHVKDKIIEMNHLERSPLFCGIYLFDHRVTDHIERLPSRSTARHVLQAAAVTRSTEIARLPRDLAGGVVVIYPPTSSPVVGKWVDKYLHTSPEVPTEHRLRILRLIETSPSVPLRFAISPSPCMGRVPPGAAHHDLPAGQPRAGEALAKKSPGSPRQVSPLPEMSPSFPWGPTFLDFPLLEGEGGRLEKGINDSPHLDPSPRQERRSRSRVFTGSGEN